MGLDAESAYVLGSVVACLLMVAAGWLWDHFTDPDLDPEPRIVCGFCGQSIDTHRGA